MVPKTEVRLEGRLALELPRLRLADLNAPDVLPDGTLRWSCAAVPEFWMEVRLGDDGATVVGMGVPLDAVVTQNSGDYFRWDSLNFPSFWVQLTL